jgi:autotransporter-associated beta strand protein
MKNRRNPFLLHSLSLAIALGAASSAHAATFTNTGTTGTVNWATGTNWSGVPVSNLDTILSYTGTLAAGVNVISNNDIGSPPFKLNQLSFTNAGPASGTAPSLTLTGSQLEFITNSSAATPTLIFNTTGTVKPVIDIQNNLLLTNNLGVAATTDGKLSGVISGGGSIAKTGAGTLTLTGNNSYGGGTTVGTGGTLVLTNSNAAGTGTIDFRGSNGNPILRLDGTGGNILLTNSLLNNGGNLVNVAGANKVTSNLSINSGTSNSYFTVDAGTLELAGNYGAGTTGRNAWFQGAGTGIYSGNLAFGNNNVRKAGTGTWILTGTNTYSGWTDVGVGTLRFAKQVSLYNNVAANWTAANLVVSSGATAAFNVGGADEFTSSDIQTITSLGTSTGGFKSGATIGLDTTNASGGTFTYGNAIDNPNGGTNTLGLLKLGTGTLKLSGSNSFTGNVGIGIGTLAITNSAALGTGSKSINLTSGGTMALDNTGTGENIELGSNLTFSNSFAGATIRNVAGDNSIASGLTISFNATNSFLRSDAGSLTIQGNIGMGGYASARNLYLQGAGNGSISGDISDTSANLSIIKQDAGIWTLSGTNSYGGATTVNDGTLAVSGILSASAVTVNNSGTVLASGSTGTIGNSVTINLGAILAAGGQNALGTATVGAGGLSFASGSIFDWDLTTGAGNGTYDTVSVSGALTVTSGAKFNVVSSTGFSDPFWDASHTWSDIFGGQAIDNFLVSDFLYSGSATAPDSEGFFSVTGSTLAWTAVPEPSGVVYGVLLSAGLFRRRRSTTITG